MPDSTLKCIDFADPDDMLAVENLYCERDDRILFEGVNFTLEAGGIIQIEGQNGSGKTSLLRILCGLSGHFEGSVFWKGQRIDRVRSEYNRSLLYVGHNSGVKAALTAEENLGWMLQLQPMLNQGSISQALEKVGLYGYEDIPCHSLSAGQQRRVGLARLYMSNAPLWILDEPFTALDKQGVSEKEALIARHADNGGCVVLTTHHDVDIPGKNIRTINLDSLVKK